MHYICYGPFKNPVSERSVTHKITFDQLSAKRLLDVVKFFKKIIIVLLRQDFFIKLYSKPGFVLNVKKYKKGCTSECSLSFKKQ
jgi:hypothetical protein